MDVNGQGDDYVYHGETRFKGIHTGNDLLVNTKEEGVIVPHLPREVFPEYYLVRVNVFDKIPETPLDDRCGGKDDCSWHGHRDNMRCHRPHRATGGRYAQLARLFSHHGCSRIAV